jgi:hypothetical protein
MATNLPDKASQTQQFFNGYFNQQITMNSDVYNQVYSFFVSRTTSASAANQLTQTVMVLTYNNKLDPLAIIRDFSKASNNSEFKTLLVTFFNSLRGPTSKIGFANNTYQNQWVQRNIKA